MPGIVTEAAELVGNIRRLRFACLAGADGSFPSTAIATKFEGTLLALETAPDVSVPPTNNFDVVVLQDGHDVLEGCGINRSSTVAQRVPITYAGVDVHPAIDEVEDLTLRIEGNVVPAAVVTVDLLFSLGHVRH